MKVLLFAARDVERDHGSTLSVLKSLYMDGGPTNGDYAMTQS